MKIKAVLIITNKTASIITSTIGTTVAMTESSPPPGEMLGLGVAAINIAHVNKSTYNAVYMYKDFIQCIVYQCFMCELCRCMVTCMFI